MAGKKRGFRSDVEVAEIATQGVCVNLAVDEPLLAAALQPVARAAWGLVHGDTDPRELRREVARAERSLRLACFAQMERRFLKEVARYLDRRAA
ncbi:MAG: hypothetical protein AB1416_00810 [Actinomycetota bacterium]